MSGSEFFRGTKEDEVRGWGKEDLMGHSGHEGDRGAFRISASRRTFGPLIEVEVSGFHSLLITKAYHCTPLHSVYSGLDFLILFLPLVTAGGVREVCLGAFYVACPI